MINYIHLFFNYKKKITRKNLYSADFTARKGVYAIRFYIYKLATAQMSLLINS